MEGSELVPKGRKGREQLLEFGILDETKLRAKSMICLITSSISFSCLYLSSISISVVVVLEVDDDDDDAGTAVVVVVVLLKCAHFT